MKFKLKSNYKPAGDQPKAIKELVDGLEKKLDRQTLLGVTGSGKTFTVANVIERIQRPTLVISHNKTLAAQLCNEFREFFPDNAVEYFVSYYDYYQPEAYIAPTDTYIEKEAQINDEIDRLRHACTQALLTRDDVIIVASVSAIYGLGSPKEYEKIVLHLTTGQKLNREEILHQLIEMHFLRNNTDLRRGQFRLRGQVLEIMPVNESRIYRFEIDEKIKSITAIDPISRKILGEPKDIWLFPAKHYIADEVSRERAFAGIREELKDQLKHFEKSGKIVEAERLKRRVKYDLELIKNIGYCNGIENYSRHFDGRHEGEPPFTLLDYFNYARKENSGFLTIIDESHVSIPQIRGMYHGDQSRKNSLVDFGFRLPSARDNRPLNFEEFNSRTGQIIFLSATPDEYELATSKKIVEQIVRPTGLVDPELIIKPITAVRSIPSLRRACPAYAGRSREDLSQIEDLITKIEDRVKKHERVLVTTLTKKMAEDLSDYLKEKSAQGGPALGGKVEYLHSDVGTIDRIRLITELREGKIDVIVGVNLLREGLDLPEVSLVAILDADKEGFLRNTTSLIQTIGRAARNVNGQVVIYADQMTESIRRAVDETNRRRKIQLAYNKKHGITPKTIEKNIKNILAEFGISSPLTKNTRLRSSGAMAGKEKIKNIIKLDNIGDGRKTEEIIKDKEKQMNAAAKELQFELAAILRDEIRELKKRMKE